MSAFCQREDFRWRPLLLAVSLPPPTSAWFENRVRLPVSARSKGRTNNPTQPPLPISLIIYQPLPYGQAQTDERNTFCATTH